MGPTLLKGYCVSCWFMMSWEPGTKLSKSSELPNFLSWQFFVGQTACHWILLPSRVMVVQHSRHIHWVFPPLPVIVEMKVYRDSLLKMVHDLESWEGGQPNTPTHLPTKSLRCHGLVLGEVTNQPSCLLHACHCFFPFIFHPKMFVSPQLGPQPKAGE